MARYIGALLLAAVVLSTGEALGACAWVLWGRVREVDPKSLALAPRVYREEYKLLSPHEAQQQCDTAGRQWLQTTAQPEVLKAMGLEGHIAGAVVFANPIGRPDAPLHMIEYQCWPDTIDPRGPKGAK